MIYACFNRGNYGIAVIERIDLIDNVIRLTGNTCCPEVRFETNDIATGIYFELTKQLIDGRVITFILNRNDKDFVITTDKEQLFRRITEI
jgi:hypothetical protein